MEKIQNPAGIGTLDLLNTSQTLLPTWTSGRGAEDKLHKQHCLETSDEFQLILTLSGLDLTEIVTKRRGTGGLCE